MEKIKSLRALDITVLILKTSIFGLIGLSLLFARPFVGIEFLGVRLGELLTLAGLLVSLIFLILPKQYLSFAYFNDLQFYSFKLIIVSFLLINIINGGDFLNTYTYKSSSFIWTTGFIFFGIITRLESTMKNSYFFNILLVVPFFTYLFASGNYPNVIIDLFIKYADKFQFLKPSDLFLIYAATNFSLKYFIKSNNRRFLYFLITSSLYAPLLLFSSRGAFLGLVVYVILEIMYSRRYILSNRRRILVYLLISSIFFTFSVLRVDRAELAQASIDQYFQVTLEEGISSSLTNIASRKDNINVWFSFYFYEDSKGYQRLSSTDPTTDWRLDIWQDITFDMYREGRVLSGYGYNEVFPQMLDPTAPGRLGRDGLNENIHNYFINIFARGGLLQFILFVIFHLGIIKYWKETSSNYQILMYIIPALIVSSLDVTMEGVQFPLIYYFFLYYFLYNSTKVKVIELYG
tara:strand:- start:21716 stop:23101 length:1386 start_codon:yes stop_codon:yes gene_type:complete